MPSSPHEDEDEVTAEDPSKEAAATTATPRTVENVLETLIGRVQKFTAVALAAMLVVVMLLSTVHLGALIVEEVLTTPRFLIRVQGLLDIFGYFLLVLIGVELLETLKAYLRNDVVHVRVVIEVALIAMARKVIIEEPNAVPGLTLLGIASLILALAIAFYFERHVNGRPASG